MSLRIGHNVEALAVTRQLNVSADRMATAMKRLSSGLRINSAADDAAGLGISERMRGQIRGLEQANRNIQDGISMLQIAEAALETVHSILHRARELAMQHNNGTYSWADKDAIFVEMQALSNEIARIEGTVEFNGVPLLQNATTTITLQVGANAGDTISVSLLDLFGAGGTSIVNSITFFVFPWGVADLAEFDRHIDDISAARGRLGAYVNRLEHAMQSNLASQEALMSAESRIRDTDMAMEMSALVKQQILQQSGTAMLAQALKNPYEVDRLTSARLKPAAS